MQCYEITEKFLRRYVQFLHSKLNGESAANYFAKLNQILKFATAEKHFRSNPATGIEPEHPCEYKILRLYSLS